MNNNAQPAPAPEPRRGITSADIDANGNVVVWDHGPHDEDADAQEWHRVNGAGPAPITMHSSDAAHALNSDPDRYGIEPFVDDGEVAAEIDAIRERREAEKKLAEERAEAAQLVADRRAAIATVMARRRAEEQAAKADRPRGPAPARMPPGNEAERLQEAADEAEAEADRVDADPNSTPAQRAAARSNADAARRAADEAR
jgi:hypothetical protein